jgi:hypothetical protein
MQIARLPEPATLRNAEPRWLLWPEITVVSNVGTDDTRGDEDAAQVSTHDQMRWILSPVEDPAIADGRAA